MLSARASVDAASRLREPMDAFATREDRMRHRTRRRVRVAAGGRVVALLLKGLGQMPDPLVPPQRRPPAPAPLVVLPAPARALEACHRKTLLRPFAPSLPSAGIRP